VSRDEGAATTDDEATHRIVCRLDDLLAERGMTLTELAERVGVSVVNLSVLKNDRARAVRFSTLTAICDALDCRPGDVLALAPAPDRSPPVRRAAGQA
jgi:putative transcriptional regulator